MTDEYWERSDWEDPVKTIRRAVVESKAKRSWMSSLYVHIDRQTSCKFYVGAAIGQSQYQKIELAPPTPGDARMGVQIGAAVSQGHYQEIPLKPPMPGRVRMGLKAGAVVAQWHYQGIAAKQPTPGSTRASLKAGAMVFSSTYTPIAAAARA